MERLIELVSKSGISKKEAKELRTHFAEQSGITIKGCMCSAAERKLLQQEVDKWLKEKDEQNRN